MPGCPGAVHSRRGREAVLADHGVTYEPYAPLTLDDEQSALIASSQVVVVFREDGHLAAISSARSA